MIPIFFYISRSRIWQEALGFKFTGESLKNRKICNKHFARDAYIDVVSYKLYRDATPTLFVTTEPSDAPSTSQVRDDFIETMVDDSLVHPTTGKGSYFIMVMVLFIKGIG